MPLAGFLIAYRIVQDWETAFIVGGALALLQIKLFLYERLSIDRFMLAVNLFVVGGAIGFLFNINWLLDLYETYIQATLFGYLVLVGIISTCCTKLGFINVEARAALVRTYSIYLLIGTLIAFGFSLYFKGHLLWAGIVPFVLLRIFRDELVRRMKISQ